MNIAITDVCLVDGTGHKPRDRMSVLIERNRISTINQYPHIPPGFKHINGQGYALIPGLIDAHKHMMNNGGDHMAVGLTLKGIKDNLEHMLRGGITSILDLGSADAARLLVHAPITKPRIHMAISIVTSPGGYPAEYMPKRFYRMGAVRECDSPASIKRTVSRLARMGVSAIKTAVVSRTFDGRPVKGWTDEQLRALTRTAHRHGLPVCAHMTYASDYAQAVRCGIDSVHHAPFDGLIPTAVVDQMIEAGIVFVPTLSLASLLIDGLTQGWCDDPAFTAGLPDALIANLRAFTNHYECCPPDQPVPGFFVSLPKKEWGAVLEYQLTNVATYIERGGTVALGTDSALGFSMHSTPVRELELLVDAGLSPVQAIQAASSHAVKVFNHRPGLGPLTQGGFADCLLVPDRIVHDIRAIADLRLVICNGTAYRPSVQAIPEPAY